MSEQEYIKGELQAIPRLENETDKNYFERVTKYPWQTYEFPPENIHEAIYDNDISYDDFDEPNQDAYICVDDVIYKFVSLDRKDYIPSFCNINKKENDTYSFETFFYNGGTSLEEMLHREFKNIKEK